MGAPFGAAGTFGGGAKGGAAGARVWHETRGRSGQVPRRPTARAREPCGSRGPRPVRHARGHLGLGPHALCAGPAGRVARACHKHRACGESQLG
jgi:hypothetical protein